MKYFSIERPVSIGTYPKPQGNRVDAIVNFDEPIFVAACMVLIFASDWVDKTGETLLDWWRRHHE